VDLEDVAGRTALNHAIAFPGRIQRMDIIRILLEQGANVNHQDRFGGVVLTEALNQNCPASVDVLMEFGAALDIVDYTKGLTPRSMLKTRRPQVIMVVQRWIRRRAGVDDPPLCDKRCDNCHTEGLKLSKCANCKTTRYCGKVCQRERSPPALHFCSYVDKRRAIFRRTLVRTQAQMPFILAVSDCHRAARLQRPAYIIAFYGRSPSRAHTRRTNRPYTHTPCRRGSTQSRRKAVWT